MLQEMQLFFKMEQSATEGEEFTKVNLENVSEVKLPTQRPEQKRMSQAGTFVDWDSDLLHRSDVKKSFYKIQENELLYQWIKEKRKWKAFFEVFETWLLLCFKLKKLL